MASEYIIFLQSKVGDKEFEKAFLKSRLTFWASDPTAKSILENFIRQIFKDVSEFISTSLDFPDLDGF